MHHDDKQMMSSKQMNRPLGIVGKVLQLLSAHFITFLIFCHFLPPINSNVIVEVELCRFKYTVPVCYHSGDIFFLFHLVNFVLLWNKSPQKVQNRWIFACIQTSSAPLTCQYLILGYKCCLKNHFLIVLQITFEVNESPGTVGRLHNFIIM